MRTLAISFICLSTFGLAIPLEAGQGGPDIALDPAIECWFHSQFPTVGADVSPFEDVIRARLYFRCSLYPDYYFVDLTVENGQFHGVAPQAEESCPAVHYYVEALSSDFSSGRTEERVADVTSENECRRRFPAAAWFSGDHPNIVLGSTVVGPSLAPGFKSIGIIGFLSSSGASTVAAAEGGLSTGAWAGIAAAGAGAAGVGVLASGGSSSTTTTAIVAGPPPTTTVATTTTVAPTPTPVKACFTLDPPSGVVKAEEPLTIDGRCSEGTSLTFRYELGDGRVKEGQPFVVAVWRQPGTYTLSLTVTGESNALAEESDTVSREITVERAFDPAIADFLGTSPSRCVGEFDASPSRGDISDYLWELDIDGRFGTVVVERGAVFVRHDWSNTLCAEIGGAVRARLTVFGRDGGSDSIVKSVNVSVARGPAQSVLESAFTTELFERNGAGQLLLPRDGVREVAGGAPVRVPFQGRAGDNAIEAVLTRAEGTPVLWRFDFSQARHFVPGSLRVAAGREVSRDAYGVVLRFDGTPGERARIELRLSE